METSVGLLVLTDILDVGRVAILQIRGEFNCETMSAETYPGGCQVTCHGKTKKGENTFFALSRLLEKELGEKVSEALSMQVLRHCNNPDYDPVPEISLESNGEGKTTITYAVILPPDVLEKIRLSPSSGGLRLLKENEIPLIENLLSFDKKTGVTDRRVVAMFPDAIPAVQKAFNVFA